MATRSEIAPAASDGMALLQAGKPHEAELSFRQALNRDPRDINALHGLGIIAHQTGNFLPAIDLYDRALTLKPDFPAALVNRGNSLAALGKFEEAAASFQLALDVSPLLVSAMVNMATSLHATGKLESAVEMTERANQTLPDQPDVLNNLGNFYKDQGRIVDAMACYERALALNPMLPQVLSNLLSATKVDSTLSPTESFQKHRIWSHWFEAVSAHAPVLSNTPDPERLIRIGYVSPDCHTAVPAFIDPVIAAHDRQHFQVYVYFNNPQPIEKLRELGVTETARIMRGLDDKQVASMIHGDGIDILIDIAGHTGHNRLGVFARRPAPVQLTWLDYLGTTGLDAMDYRITDEVADPLGSEAFHSEKLVRLPHTQWCWQPDAAAPDVTELPACRNGFITFGSFNNVQKLTDATLRLWARLLKEIPSARLRVAGIPEGFARHRLQQALACELTRLTFLPRASIGEYRALFSAVDIALDPMPFSGATTTLDALWQGVPVLTLPGETSCSRSTASLLTQLQMKDWIANDADGFVARAKKWADDVLLDTSSLVSLRSSLRGRLKASALVDAKAFTRDLESEFRKLWRQWCHARLSAGCDPDKLLGTDSVLQQAKTDAEVGRIDEAMTSLRAILSTRPDWELAQREFARVSLAWSKAHPEVGPAWIRPVTPQKRHSISAIICSIRPDYFASIKRKLTEQFSRHAIEVIGIHDATSLCEGYNRGAAQAVGDVLIFCHDDIDVVHADFGERLLTHLETHDVVGVVGASKLVNGDWGHAGPPYTHGQIIHRPPGESGNIYLGVGLQSPLVDNICALDGVFLAMHRRVWESVLFDEETFDGFHLYDIDFTWRASQSGFKLVVPMDLLLIHFSTGRYDMKWQTYNVRFLKKFPQLTNLPSSRRYANLHVKLQNIEQVERLHTALMHFRFGAV